MRYALAGLSLFVAAVATTAPAQAHDRYYYAPYPRPPVRYVVPPPRYYQPPPTYYYAPAPVYAYPRPVPYGYYPAYRYRPYHQTPQGSATFFFKF